jgi:penicillin-binding protein 1A
MIYLFNFARIYQRMKNFSFFWRKGLWSLISLGFVAACAFALIYIYLLSQLPSVDALKSVELQVPLQIYSQDGQLIQEYGEKRRIPLTYEQIPQTLVRAVLATEDQRFFEHPGVDILGLGRAALKMVQTGTKSQGGSTITMQVARNFFLDRKKTFWRKFNEILLAIKIDQELPKEKILELYLNKIYLGNRAYGVGAAAQIYYGKNISELSIAELATIAGLPQAPSAHNPIANPKAALKRRNHVLERLLEEKYISQTEYENAIAEPINASYHGPQITVEAPYVAEMIRQSLYAHFGEDAYTQGFKVYTTIHSSLQNTANDLIEQHLLNYEARHGYHGPISHFELKATASKQDLNQILSSHLVNHDLIPGVVTQVHTQALEVWLKNGETVEVPWAGLSWARPALKNGWMGASPSRARQICQRGDVIYLRKLKKHWQLAQIPNLEAALLSLNPQNGAIEALVGGFNFQSSKFNRVTQSQRQPGSSFKPFIYAAALSKGYNLSSIVNDAPIVIQDSGPDHLWRPHNVNNTFNGPTRLRDALAHSRNLVSIRLLDDIGIDYAIQYVTRFGFDKKQLPHALSLALGSLSLSPMELTTAYAVIANGGYQVSPFMIDHISNRYGEIQFQANPARVCQPLERPDNGQNCAQRVIPEDLAFLIHSALQSVIEEGTAVQAKSLGRRDLAGKTGTTNDQVDAWFAGYHPQLVTTTWFGYDTPKPIHEYAAALALPLWIDFMKVALKQLPEQIIAPPANVQSILINPRTGQRSYSEQGSMPEFFSEQSLPADTSDTEENTINTNSPVSEENLF